MKRSFLTGIEAGGNRRMHATEVLQKCLGKSLQPIHTLRSRAPMRAVEATITGRRLTLIDLARAWPDAQRIRAPLKALDRLLGNRHLHPIETNAGCTRSCGWGAKRSCDDGFRSRSHAFLTTYDDPLHRCSINWACLHETWGNLRT